MKTAARLGLLGGTFDPIHVGHLAAADAARTKLGLDRVLLLPSHVPPHRPQPLASVHHRFAMVALAVANHAGLEASDLELTAPGPSYTAATLDRLQGSRHGRLVPLAGRPTPPLRKLPHAEDVYRLPRRSPRKESQ